MIFIQCKFSITGYNEYKNIYNSQYSVSNYSYSYVKVK